MITAQIWLTYEDMAMTFGGTINDARQSAIENGWARAKGRDGVAHVRLTPALAHEYLRKRIGDMAPQRDMTIDQIVSSFRAVLSQAGGRHRQKRFAHG